MAIAFDAATNDQVQGGSSTLNFSHTCTGSNRFLVVACWWGSGANTITATYNGVSMTAFGTTDNLKFFYLINPASGANTLAVTHSAAVWCCSASYTGVHQTTYLNGSTNQVGGSGATETNAVTTTIDNSWVIAGVYQDGTDIGGLSANSGTILRATAATTILKIADSNLAITPAGSHSQVWNALGTGTPNWNDYAFGLAPALGTTSVKAKGGLITLKAG